LSVSDNGKGFDTALVKPESLGVGIMRERAKKIAATVNIESKPDEGTNITVSWKENNRESAQ
jgi:two-component system nitrate/nitrite sensor histidine kinase NarX